MRSPMQVDEEFHKRMKKLQKEIMKKDGEFKGAKKITGEMIHFPEWDLIEKKILGKVSSTEFKINFDGRKR